MTVGFNCKTTFWYFLYIFCCRNFPDDDDADEENIPRHKTSDIIKVAKTTICRILSQRSRSERSENKKTDLNSQTPGLENVRKQSTSSWIVVGAEKEDNKSCEDICSSADQCNKGTSISNTSDWQIGDQDDVDDDKLQYPVNDSDDDSISISDVNFDQCLSAQEVEEFEPQFSDNDERKDKENIEPLTVFDDDSRTNYKEVESDQKSSPEDIAMPDRNVYKVELEDIFSDQFKDFQSTSFMDPAATEACKRYSLSKSEDFWELADPIVDDPLELMEYELSLQTDVDDHIIGLGSDVMTTDDKAILRAKIQWLIPLKQEHLEIYIESAISYFFQVKQNCNLDNILESLKEASKTLPNIFTEGLSTVSETDIAEALIDNKKQNPYIDKRIIFHMIGEMFSEIYSHKRRLPQMPWIPLSNMLKQKNYTLWKDNQPPESYDLVSQIIREQIYEILNSNILFKEGLSEKQTKKCSNFNIIKWCDTRQKEIVDKVLTKELRSEENEWVLYDDSEVEIKIQIAENIFDHLITETISWLECVRSEYGNS